LFSAYKYYFFVLIYGFKSLIIKIYKTFFMGNKVAFYLMFISFFSSLKAQFIVNFSANPLSVCVGQQINFTDLSSSPSGIVSWVWDFGDGNSSTIQNPSHTYNVPGTYTVILTANNGSSSVSEVKSNYIVVNPLPQPSFNVSNPPCSLPASVNISNVLPSSGVNYQWNFGNGQTSNLQNPNAINYSSEGSYTIQLTVTNSSTGCSNSTSQTVNVFNYSAGFSFNPQTICVGSTVNFTNTSSPGTNAYNWSFGNGTNSSEANPSTTYNSPGSYTVTLNSQNTNNGCSAQSSQTITVINAQLPTMTPSITVGCNPSVINFTNTSTFNGTFSWVFGNGNSFNGTTPPPQTYSIPSTSMSETFTVFLFSTDANGCSSGQSFPNIITIFNLFPSFSIDQNDGCEILPVNFTNTSISPVPSFPITNWQWNFGNGQTSNQQNPPTQFYPEGVYNVSLTVSTDNGCSQTIDSIGVIEVGIPPTALFTVAEDTICARQNLTFTNQSWVFNVGNNTDLEYEWYIGEQGPFNLFEPNNIPVTDTGSLDITLIVYFRGCPDTLILENAVYVWGPLVQYSAPSILCNPQLPIQVTISDNSILGQQNDNVEVFWSLGDGTAFTYNSSAAWQNNNQSFNHTYNNYGSFLIKQKITNIDNGCSDSLEQTLNINFFELNLNLANDSNCVNSPTEFNWSYVSINNFVPFFYFYNVDNTNIGNSAIGNISNPFAYTFSQPGEYQITVGATNTLGCQSTASQNVIVTALPNVQIGNTNVLGCAPTTISFESTSTSVSGVPINGYSWTFNGVTPVDGNGGSTFTTDLTSSGENTIQLTVIDALGCSASQIETFNIIEPLANFEIPDVICNNSEITLNNLSSNYQNSEWFLNGVLVSNQNNATITINYPQNSNVVSYTDVITLTVSNSNGCSNSLELPILISSPNASFSHNLVGANVDENGNFSCPPVFGFFTDESNSIGDITSWSWVFGDGKTSSLQNPSNTYVFAGSYTASLTIQDEYGCESTIIFDDFLVISGPSGDFGWQPAGTLCDPNYIFEVFSVNNVSQIEWFPGNNTSFTSNNGGEYIYPDAGTFAPYVIITDANNCAVTYYLDTLTIFFGNLNASFTVNPTELNWGVPLNVVNESTGGIGGIINNNWTIGSVNFNNQNPQFTYLTDDAGNIIITLIVTDSLGCVDSASVSIVVNTELEIPNVFTPNGDGVNDFFVFIANAYKEYEAVILNRWGNEVSRIYVVNDNYLWDGKSQNGELAKEGVYFYQIQGILRDGTPRKDHGFVHLVLE
jgi:gliding motility-associated-like protein